MMDIHYNSLLQVHDKTRTRDLSVSISCRESLIYCNIALGNRMENHILKKPNKNAMGEAKVWQHAHCSRIYRHIGPLLKKKNNKSKQYVVFTKSANTMSWRGLTQLLCSALSFVLLCHE